MRAAPRPPGPSPAPGGDSHVPLPGSVILAAPASGAGVQARAARPALTWPQSLNPQR